MLFRIIRSALVVCALVAVAACESVDPTYELNADHSVSSVREARVFTPATATGCLFFRESEERFAAALAGVILPNLVSTGLSTAQKAMAQAAERMSGSFSAQTNVLPVDGTLPECVEIISGQFEVFQPDDPRWRERPPEPEWLKRYDGIGSKNLWADLYNMLKRQGVMLAGEPDFVAEIALVTAKAPRVEPDPPVQTTSPPVDAGRPATTTAAQRAEESQVILRLVPVFLAFNRPIEELRSLYRPHAVTEITVKLGFQTVGEGNPSKLLAMSLDRVKVGQMVRFNAAKMVDCGLSNDAGTKGSMTCPGNIAFIKESYWTSIKMLAGKPVTIAAQVDEVRQPSAYVKFFADVFGSSQGAVAKDIDTLLPGGQVSADTARLNAGATLAGRMSTAARDLQACVSANTTNAVTQALAQVAADEASANAAAYAVSTSAADQPFGPPPTRQSECSAHLSAAQTYITTKLPALMR